MNNKNSKDVNKSINKSKTLLKRSVSPINNESKKRNTKKYRLMINVYNCKYDIVREVSKDYFKMKV